MPRLDSSAPLAVLLALVACVAPLAAATAPTLVARPMGTTTAPYGYVEALPTAYYDDPSAKCPLILFLHGLGEEGAGTDATALKSAICRNSSPLDLINRGGALGQRFNTENAICLGPQSPVWWNSSTIHQFLAYAYATYPKIDRTRVYVTGLSMGGGGTWDYVAAHGEDVAACIPCCGASSPGSGSKFTGVATWSFHAWDDPTVTRQNSVDWSNEVAKWVGNLGARTDVMATYPYGNGTSTVAASIQTAKYTAAGGWTWVSGVDAAVGPSPKFTMYTSGGHGGGWTPTYNNSQVWDWLFAQRQNQPPTISAIADCSIAAGTSTGAIAFTVGDSATAVGSLTLSASTSNAYLVPVANIVFGGSGANRTVTATPVAGVGGTATITVTVSDGSKTASEPFTLTVTGGTTSTFAILVDFGAASAGAAGDGPTSGNWNNITATANGAVTSAKTSSGTTTAIGIAVTNGFVGVNSNGISSTTLFPATAVTDSFYVQSGADNLGVVTISGLDPVATYDVDLFASRSASDDRTTNYTIGGVTKSLNAANNVSQMASFTNLVPSGGGLVLSVAASSTAAYGYLGVLRLTQRPTAVGGGNTAPTISAIADRSVATGVSTGAIAFTVDDAQTAAGSLTLSAASSNTTLVPLANIVFGGSGGSRTVTVTPAAGQTGTAMVTVTVSDGSLTASEPFTLTVTATADTTPPATPAAPTVSSTTSATPTLSGTTEAGASVAIYDDGVLIGTVTANGSGAWSWTVSPPLAAGTHHLTVVATDAALNHSAASPATSVDVAAPPGGGGTTAASGSSGAGGACGAGAIAGLLLSVVGLRRRRR